MSNKYYVIVNGAQQGPFEFDQLKRMEITPDTFVWSPAMKDWMRAGDVDDLRLLFMPEDDQSAFGSYAQPQSPIPSQFHAGSNQGYGNVPQNIPHTNWMPWAIVGTVLGTLFSCVGMIFGIIGIVNASKANRFYYEGDENRGKMNNTTARTMTIIALALSVLGLVLTVTGVTSRLFRMLLEQNYGAF